eukprot:9194872-Karenia_brevis.AAC.1
MNTKDAPYVVSATDDCWGGRLRAIRSQCTFVNQESEVDHAKYIFLADASYKTFLASPAAACVWWRYVLIPYKNTHTEAQCRQFIECPGGQVMEDTLWLQRQMSRQNRPAGEVDSDEGKKSSQLL